MNDPDPNPNEPTWPELGVTIAMALIVVFGAIETGCDLQEWCRWGRG